MRHSTSNSAQRNGHRPNARLAEPTPGKLVGWRSAGLFGLIAIGLLGGCVTGKAHPEKKIEPIGEAELAAKKLQDPLDKHLCKAAIHPIAKADWKLTRVASLIGRGPNFQAALEALCREADGQKFPAIVDIYYERAVTAWSPNHAVRGTAVRFGDGVDPPAPPELAAISPPLMPKATDDEPLPAGEAVPPPPPPNPTARSGK